MCTVAAALSRLYTCWQDLGLLHIHGKAVLGESQYTPPLRRRSCPASGSVGLLVPVLELVLEDEQDEEELLVHLRNITADCKRLLDFSQTSSSF